MIQRKNADGDYIFPQQVVFGNQMPRVMGVPIVATNAINGTDGNVDDFLVADFPQLTTLFDREGMSVRFYEQDQDNVVKDLVTVQISGRLALPLICLMQVDMVTSQLLFRMQVTPNKEQASLELVGVRFPYLLLLI